MNTTANGITSYIISKIEFVANYVTLGPESQMLVNRLNPDKIQIRTQSWKQTAGLLPVGVSGSNEVLCNIRVNSLKSIFSKQYFYRSRGKIFRGMSKFRIRNWMLCCRPQLIPQRSLDPSTKTADCFAELQKSMGALNCVNYNGCISKSGYYTSSLQSGL
jgi:hypothetical protein